MTTYVHKTLPAYSKMFCAMNPRANNRVYMSYKSQELGVYELNNAIGPPMSNIFVFLLFLKSKPQLYLTQSNNELIISV